MGEKAYTVQNRETRADWPLYAIRLQKQPTRLVKCHYCYCLFRTERQNSGRFLEDGLVWTD